MNNFDDFANKILENDKPVERCLWCKYGAINHSLKQIYCHKLDKFCDKDDTCNKWRYGI